MVVAVVGWGRFGRAVGERLLERGETVRSWDPRAPIPAEIAADSPASAARGASIVLLCVPVPATEAALSELRPALSGDQLLIEAGSVKVGPVRALEAVLGPDIPWAATHPLFGPVSLALGEKPLRTVVCRHPLHPGAQEHAAGFWRSFGSEIEWSDAESHDREMARTHALAFFVAKAFLDCGIDLDRPFLPPSVRGIARTVASARGDAGQLFSSLHRENPYADDARTELLDALHRTDDALRAPAPPGEAEALRLPDPVETPPDLREVRDLIDDVDAELLALLGRRAGLALRALSAKSRGGRSIRDPRREADLLSSRRAAATAAGLDPEAVQAIFRAILNFSRLHQAEETSR